MGARQGVRVRVRGAAGRDGRRTDGGREVREAKRALRRRAAAALAAVPAAARAAASAAACGHLTALPAYRAAGTVLWYAAMRGELATADAVAAALAAGKRVVVPWCGGEELGLWRLEAWAELAPGTWDIPEPPPARRGEPERQVAAREIELVVAPGLAFDRRGRRLGHGKGYYDRLFARAPDALRAGLCFSAQVFAEVPAGPLDAAMDWVVTERGASPTGRRPAGAGGNRTRGRGGPLSGGSGC